MTRVISVLGLLLYSTCAFNQNRNANWMFGDHWISFATGEPALVSEAPFATPRASLSAPANAQLRVYMAHNGATQLVDADHQLLAGTPAWPPGNYYGSQENLFVPRPSDSDGAFFVTARRLPSPPPLPVQYGFLRLFVGGPGDVPAVLDTGYTWFMEDACEKRMVVPHGNGIDYWFVGQLLGLNTYHAYRITAVGITEPPVVSQTGTAPPPNDWAGEVCFTVQGDQFMNVSHRWSTTADNISLVELFSFDDATGSIVHQLTFTSLGRVRGVEFSPSGRFLYVADKMSMQQVAFGAFSTRLFQYDLWANDVLASRILLDSAFIDGPGITTSPTAVTALGLAPDGRIYIAHDPWVPHLGVIAQPNLPAPDCAYVVEGFNTGTPMWWLPSFMKRYHDDISLSTARAGTPGAPRIVPNPLSAQCELLLPGADGPCSVAWLDALGRTTRVQQVVIAGGRATLDASGLSAGPYLLRSEFGDGRPAVIQRAWVQP